jgi:hypothetical protein
VNEQKSEQNNVSEAAYPMWRYHLWHIGYGSYNDIEAAVDAGKLRVFTCTKADCDCRWPKQSANNPVVQPDGVVEAAQLLPCPFCGGDVYLQRLINEEWQIGCYYCPVKSSTERTSREMAVTQWNTRAPTPESITEKAARVTRKIINGLPYEIAQHVNRQLLTTIITTEFGVGGGQGENKS